MRESGNERHRSVGMRDAWAQEQKTHGILVMIIMIKKPGAVKAAPGFF